jgi:hypothetical protein
MRSTQSSQVHALLFVLVWTGLWVQSSCAQPPRPPSSFQEEDEVPVKVKVQWTETAGGPNKESSRERAVRLAQRTLEDYLWKQEPPVEWRPRRRDVEKLIKGEPEKKKTTFRASGQRLGLWKWTFVVTYDDWRQILRRDRELRAKERMGLLARILAGLVALLAVVAAYIRLDEWTKGFYTGRLRLAGLAVLALVAAGLKWLS